MGDPYRKYSPNEHWQPKAQWLNAVTDALQKSRRESVVESAESIDVVSDGIVRVVNVSAQAIDQYGIVGLGNLAITPATLQDFRNWTVFNSAAPDPQLPFGIALEPIPAALKYVATSAGALPAPGALPSPWIMELGVPAPWNGASAYLVGNLATSGGNTYICVLAHTNQAPPNATYWLLLATDRGIYVSGTVFVAGDIAATASVGKAAIAGYAKCQVTIANAAHQYASPAAGNYAALTSQIGPGPARIVSSSGGWSVVVFVDPLRTLPFTAHITSPAKHAGLWTYGWVEQQINPATGVLQDATGGRSGDSMLGPWLYELNNNIVLTPAYHRVQLRGFVAGVPVYDFDCCCVLTHSPVVCTTDAFLVRRRTAAHATDAYLAILGAHWHATDGFLVHRPSFAHTTDGFLVVRGNQTHTTDAYQVRRLSARHSAWMYCVHRLSRLHKTTCFVAPGPTPSGHGQWHATDAVIGNYRQLAHTIDAYVAYLESAQHATDCFLRALLRHTTDCYLAAAGPTVFDTSGTFTATATSHLVECWGSGANANNGGGINGGSGGGGGSYASKTVSGLTIGNSYTVNVDTANNAGSSYFIDTITVNAPSGSGFTGGALGIGTTAHIGGNGGGAGATTGGGGGGSATSSAAGTDGAGGGSGGAGGGGQATGGNGNTGAGNGTAGGVPGAGGGGGGPTGNGGGGAHGRVQIT